ncbi:MAG: hypothetical protein ACE5DO_15255, partial [Desulfobacterales bacterium]
SYRIMTRLFEAKGLRFVDLMPVFNKFQKQGIQCYGEIDSHFTDDGHRIAANTILPNILDMMRENIKLRKIEKNATVTGHKLSNKN